MRNRIYSLLIAGGCLFLTGCNDFLDTLPDNRAEIDTEEKVKKLLVSAYPGNSEVFMFEYMSDNTDMYDWNLDYDNFHEETFFWKDMTDRTNDSQYQIWNSCYKSIAAANQVMDKYKELGEPETLRSALGEALITRAYNHFLLVNTFCMAYGADSDKDMGIPYAIETEINVKPAYERGTVAEVYEKINADIEQALPLIDDNLYEQPKYHFNRRAAYAFASLFNLYYNKPDKVIEYANWVLGERPESMLRNWQAYGGLSANGVIQPNEYLKKDAPATLLVSFPTSNWSTISGPYLAGNKFAHSRLVAESETMHALGPWGDQNNFHVKTYWNESVNKIIFRKVGYYMEFTDPVANTGYIHSSRVHFTTDEVLLCRAEAYILKKEYAKAYSDLTIFMSGFAKVTPSYQNILDFYDGLEYYTPTAPTPKKALSSALYAVEAGEQENLMHYLLHLRRILTLHEGRRWMDVKRHGITIYRRLVDRSFTVSEVMDELLPEDPRRAIQLPPEVISAGMTSNPR